MNRLPNPDFEDTSLAGWVGQSGAVLSSVNGVFGKAVQAACPGVQMGEGLLQATQPAWSPPTRVGDVVMGRALIKGTAGANLQLQVLERDATNAFLASNQIVFAASGDWQQVSLNYTISQAASVKATIKIVTAVSIQAVTFLVDNIYLDYAGWLQSFIARRRRR